MSDLLKKIVALEHALTQSRTEEYVAETNSLAASLASRLFVIDEHAPLAERELAYRGLIALAGYYRNHLNFATFRMALRAALAIAATVSPQLHLEALLRTAEGNASVGDIGRALDHVSAAISLSKAGNGLVMTVDTLRRALALYANALLEAGLHTQADAMFARVLTLLGGEPAPRLRANVWNARVGIFAKQAQLQSLPQAEGYTAAIHACEHALHNAALCEGIVRQRLRILAHANRILLELLLGNLNLAEAQIAAINADIGGQPIHQWLHDVMAAFIALCHHNGEVERATIEHLLAQQQDLSTQWQGELLSVLAALYMRMGDSANTARAFARSVELRTQSMWATLSKPVSVDARALEGNDISDVNGNRLELDLASMDLLERLAVTAELRDDDTGKHCYRVGRLTKLLALRAGWNETESDKIEYAARLHDIGKFAIPDAILLKPGRLTPPEMELMRRHTSIGAELLAHGEGELLALSAQIACHHHEWWDGSGYPDGLRGEAIPFAARTACIVDVYDALTHKRAYKSAWTHEAAMQYIVEKRGVQFDPILTDHFVALMQSARTSWDRFVESLELPAGHALIAKSESRLREVIEAQEDILR